MPNRRLTPPEIASLNKLQASTVEALDAMATGDPELLFALRRRLFTRLMHLERGTPAHRNKLKAEQWQAQRGLCAMCNGSMEQKGSELDRFVAWKGYTTDNTRLVHHDCHVADQRRKGFSDVEADIAEHLDDLDAVASEVDTCEIMTDDGWALIDVDEALGLCGAMLRCPACHGRVRAHRAGTTGQRAHFEHLQRHDGCPLKNGYSGVSSEHPDPVQGPPTQRDVGPE